MGRHEIETAFSFLLDNVEAQFDAGELDHSDLYSLLNRFSEKVHTLLEPLDTDEDLLN